MNKYQGYCVDCGRDVSAGHGELNKQGQKWIISCGRKAEQLPAGAKAPENPVMLNSAPVRTAQAQRLTDEQAAEILAKEGREFVRPLPAGAQTLGVGYKITIDGKELEIGTCNQWVGIVTDWKHQESSEPAEYVISLIDGTVLESGPYRKTKGLHYWTRMLGAPQKLEREGKNSVKLGALERDKNGTCYIVTAIDKAYYMSAEDAEDMDMFDRGGGWATPYERREVTLSQADREHDAEIARKRAAVQALKDFENRVTSLQTRIEEWDRDQVVTLRKWSTASHPSYGSPFYRAVYAVQLSDGRKGYRFTDSFYDWPQDYIAVVDEFFADEPHPATEAA